MELLLLENLVNNCINEYFYGGTLCALHLVCTMTACMVPMAPS